MPPARGMAPPLRPVPAPRPTMGTLCSMASLTMAADVFGGSGKDNDLRARLVDAAVVFVEGEILRPVEVAFGAQQLVQGAGERWRDHMLNATRSRCVSGGSVWVRTVQAEDAARGRVFP